ncbi:MAG: DUF6944 family repetitive protein [Bacillus sp. (in: firmicutes)]
MTVQTDGEQRMTDNNLQGSERTFTGVVLLLVGSILNALGLTNVYVTRSPAGAEGIIVGNALESLGNTYVAIGTQDRNIETEDIERTIIAGDWLQALGNAGNVIFASEGVRLFRYSFSDQGSREERVRLGEIPLEELNERSLPQRFGTDQILKRIAVADTISNGLQGTGSLVVAEAVSRLPAFCGQQDEVIGNLFVGLGGFIQAAGGLVALNQSELRGVLIQTIGAWLQVAGVIREFKGEIEKLSETMIKFKKPA